MGDNTVILRSEAPPPWRRYRWLLLLCLFPAAVGMASWLAPEVAVAAGRVVVVLSQEGEAYRQVADAIEQGLAAAAGSDVTLSVGVAAPADAHPDLVVAVGDAATEQALVRYPKGPLLSVLVPSDRYRDDTKGRAAGGRVSAIFLDQPLSRQVDLIRVALPGRTALGVVVGPDSAHQLEELRSRATARGLAVQAAKMAAGDNPVNVLPQVLTDGGVFLALADPAVFNRRSIQSILLTTYHHRVPLLGYSASYTKAGALISLFSTPAQIGREAAELIVKMSASGRWELPPPHHPRYFSVTVNDSVARALGLDLPDGAALEQALSRLEGKS